MLDLMQRVNWDEYLFFLSQGHPPVSLQLARTQCHARGLLARPAGAQAQVSADFRLVAAGAVLAGNVGVIAWGSQLSF
jgi:hypothetical protein